jgi:catechol 2,3-dioxygenase-like lactoylglutathione lyase family enzyme
VSATLNHVSVGARDLETSRRFYVEELGLVPLPTPVFDRPTLWLRAGSGQVHLFERPDAPSVHGHFALEVAAADFVATYRRMEELGALDSRTFGSAVFELPDGGLQLYVRDPAGNLVELDCRDGASVSRDEVEVVLLADLRPQDGDAARATLWHRPDGA